MDMRVDAAGSQDTAFPGDDLGAGTDDDIDAGLRVGIARLADGGDLPALEADIRLDDMPRWSTISALVMTVSMAPSLRAAWLWPMPSRMTLPPPNFTSSP